MKKKEEFIDLDVTTKTDGSERLIVSKIYLIVDDISSKNSNLERNKKILSAGHLEFEVVQCREMKNLQYN